MRGFVNPRKSAAHKLACLSLYRGLLRQASRLSDQEISFTLSTLIRRRFRLDCKCQSLTIINDAISTGRNAYQLVRDAANGSTMALSQLKTTMDEVAQYQQEQTILRRHQNNLRSPTSPTKFAKIAHLTRSTSKEWTEKIPNPIPIAQRPAPKDQLPNPDQPRRVPVLTASQGFPFLRYKSGAQSPKLSRVLNDLYTQEFKRWEVHNRLLEEIDHTLLEDDWDRLLHQYAGFREHNGGLFDQSWAEDTRDALRELQITLREAASRRADTAQRMWSIAQQERELAELEKREQKDKARKQGGRGIKTGEGKQKEQKSNNSRNRIASAQPKSNSRHRRQHDQRPKHAKGAQSWVPL